LTNPVLIFICTGFLFALAFSCQQKNSHKPTIVKVDLPDYFPPIPLPDDNPLSREKIELGKKLFFDPILSRHKDLSCSSCHLPALAFTDGKVKSINVGGEPTLRNAPSLLNIAYHPYFFMDGGNPTLESQLIAPIENPLEMDLPFPEAVNRVASDSEYIFLFKKVFDTTVSPFTLSRAIAAYERSLLSYNSPFDQYHYQKKENALSEKAKAGFKLFKSEEFACSSCHSGVLFTDFKFRNNGLKDNYEDDPGRGRITLKDEDIGKFKTPSLRNVALTAPYMHDGSLKTLDEVLMHYASGGSKHTNKDSLIKGFELTETDKELLIEFLKSLNDTSSYRQ